MAIFWQSNGNFPEWQGTNVSTSHFSFILCFRTSSCKQKCVHSTRLISQTSQAPYTGPYKVIAPGHQTFQVQIGNHQETVSIYILKLAFLEEEQSVKVAIPPVRGRPPKCVVNDSSSVSLQPKAKDQTEWESDQIHWIILKSLTPGRAL